MNDPVQRFLDTLDKRCSIETKALVAIARKAIEQRDDALWRFMNTSEHIRAAAEYDAELAALLPKEGEL